MGAMPMDYNEKVAAIRLRLAKAADGRYPVPEILAVSKTRTAQEIAPLQGAGITLLGENHAQEIVAKQPVLGQNFRFHMIGRLQTNKVKAIIDRVAMVQSLDRLSLAQELDRRAQAAGRVMDVLVQVSPAGEAQKGGLPPEELPAFLNQVRLLPGLQVRGLMAVMPKTEDQALLLRLFASMRTLFEQERERALQRVEMQTLSMGMSGDYLLAARCGATMVRLGTALFGPRPPKAAAEMSGGMVHDLQGNF